MVERVARGKLIVPAAATLSLIATGMAGPNQAWAAGGNTTLQIRVQVVESCQIRVSDVGQLAQSCGGGGIGTTLPFLPIGEMVDSVRERFPAFQPFPPRARWHSDGLPPQVRVDTAEHIGRANERAKNIAERIAQRVRYITVAY